MPRWVVAAIVVYACVPPLTHAWLHYAPPEGTVHTGLHIPDSVIFLHAMDMFASGFDSPYASAESPWGDASPHYYPAPFLWMYGVLGFLGRMLHFDSFLWLGLLNGFGLAVYLAATFAFMQRVDDSRGPLAFAAYLLLGGVGGVAFLISRWSGWMDAPGFDESFLRLAMYDLLEGPRMQPMLLAPRLYYTLPLALGFVYLAHEMKPKNGKHGNGLFGFALLAISTTINVRYGPIFLTLHGLLIALNSNSLSLRNYRPLMAPAFGCLLGVVITAATLRLNPGFSDNVFALIRRSLWPTPFVLSAPVHLAFAGVAVVVGVRRISGPWRMLAGAGLGYLIAFVFGFAAYHVYYGQLWPTADFSAPVRISDWALLGVLPGAWLARRSGGHRTANPATALESWLMLWLIGFTAIAISAWGQGWFLRFAPQRLVVFIGPPLCLLAVHGYEQIRVRRARFADTSAVAGASFALVSLVVGTLCIQGPLGRYPGRPPLATLHADLITAADAECITAIGPGRVMTPNAQPAFGDIISLRGNRVLHGLGAWDLSDKSAYAISEALDAFYDPALSDADRQSIAGEWGIDWVYCPDSIPVGASVEAAFDRTPWLELMAHSGRARVYQVRLPASSPPDR